MGRDTKAGDVDAHDADAVDFAWQHAERHARGRGDAEVGDDDGVELLRIRHLVHGLDDVLV